MIKHADILVKNGIVLTMDADNRQIESGYVAICGDSIAAVGTTDELSEWDAGYMIDAKGGIIMPGLVNTHTHAAMTLFRGLADDLPLMEWLHQHIFPAEARLDRDKVYVGTLLACAEMILSGTTCFCDMYLFESAVAFAAKDAGMRAVVGEVLFDFPSPNYGPILVGFTYTRELIRHWKNDPLITIAVEPHSPYLCEPRLLITAAKIAKEYNVPLVIHLSETQHEVEQIQSKYGKTPVAHLADLGILGPNLIACHCVMLTEEDIALLKQYDVKVAHNPESNMKLASGIAPIPKLIDAGICVGLGTDGCSSNNNLDMISEMNTCAKLHKVGTLDPTVMNAQTTLRMATIGGARVLGLDKTTGSLEVGKRADIIVIDTRKPHLMPMYHPMSVMVYAARGSDVATSIINGRIVMENRKLKTIDLESVIADAKKAAEEFKAFD
jgi:5-methylthioadenosine/S-adenosylhomocysteine deaminase